MRVPLSWLREFVSIEASIEELAARLSMLGLSVEEIIRTGEGIVDVRVGQVLEVRDHPSSNKPLVLVKADVGEPEPLDIVCGARNFKAGDLVPVAVPGARLPNGMQIVKRKLAGETSNGMLCSARELGVSDDHSGILVLSSDFTIGDDVREALELDDVIFDLEVTPNRPDCLSILGVARELAASYHVALHDPEVAVREAPSSHKVSIVIEDEIGCPRYVGRVLSGLSAMESPWPVKRRLLACGMRPISLVVDVTNYVMLERGQPLHAFDLDHIHGSKIIVRKARDNETMTTLDDVSRSLSADDIVIADADRAIAIAGVMGGSDTEVSDATHNVLIESATFDATRVLRSARRIGMRTEASIRFERGVDPEGAKRAADRAASLLADLGGAVVEGPAVESGPGPAAREPIELAPDKINAFLGIEIEAEEMRAILTGLGFDVSAGLVTPPSWRPDISIPQDLSEEIARHHGFDRIPITLPDAGRCGGLTHEQTLKRVARRAMLGAGLSEAQTLSLIDPGFADRLSLPPTHSWRKTVAVSNPLSADASVLRPSLLPGLMQAASINFSRRTKRVALFEIGVSFAPSEPPVETLELAWIMGGVRPLGWHEASKDIDFYDASGALTALCEALGVSGMKLRPAELGAPHHPARAAEVLVNGSAIGFVAELHPRCNDALDLPKHTAVGCVGLDSLIEAASTARMVPLPKFPASERDIALIVPEAVTALDVSAVLSGAAGKLLESIVPFDRFVSPQFGEGKVSIAFSMSFRDPDRTLTDEEVNKAFSNVVAAAKDHGWIVRD
ncbi:MAG: phenylalanine--tRNA ligase subunit beta [Actinomycetota bacterium]